MIRSPNFKDITGQRFGRLIVVSFTDTDECGRAYWDCVCDCGGSVVAAGFLLRIGKVKSCGCLQPQAVAQAKITHGKSKTRTYRIWSGMVKRCTCPTNSAFEKYSQLGIDPEFLTFEGFYAVMGDCPAGMSIDRIENDKGYFRGNVRWANAVTQQRNTSRNRRLTYNGETRCLQEWAELTGSTSKRIFARLKLGWSLERALTEPRWNRGKPTR